VHVLDPFLSDTSINDANRIRHMMGVVSNLKEINEVDVGQV
jgi:hypothetical protein